MYDWNIQSVPMVMWDELVPLYIIRGQIDDSLLSNEDRCVFDNLNKEIEKEEEFIIPYLLTK